MLHLNFVDIYLTWDKKNKLVSSLKVTSNCAAQSTQSLSFMQANGQGPYK